MVATDSSQSAAPYHSLIPMQPSPCAETSRSPTRTRSMLIGDLLRAWGAAGPAAAGERAPTYPPAGGLCGDGAEAAPVGLRGGADDPAEVVPQDGGGAQPA